MFGNNSDNDQNTSAVANDYSNDLPVGGEDLISSGPAPAATPQPQQPTQDYAEPNAPYTPPATPVDPVQDVPSPDPVPDLSSSPVMDNDSTTTPGSTDDLISIKQGALEELKPLVSHLDQSPEEKFRTTMMMIQAADDKSLLQDAYSQAQAIPDEKVRAQALLDVVNEINYFTQIESQE